PADSAAHVNRTVDFVLEARRATKEKDKFRYSLHAETLGTLAGQLDAKVAARVADVIVATLGDFYMSGPLRTDFVDGPADCDGLGRVAERPDASDSLRAAEGLIPVLKKVEKFGNLESLRKALVGVCRRLDADGSKRVAEAIALAVQDAKTPVLART